MSDLLFFSFAEAHPSWNVFFFGLDLLFFPKIQIRLHQPNLLEFGAYFLVGWYLFGAYCMFFFSLGLLFPRNSLIGLLHQPKPIGYWSLRSWAGDLITGFGKPHLSDMFSSSGCDLLFPRIQSCINRTYQNSESKFLGGWSCHLDDVVFNSSVSIISSSQEFQ